MNVDLPLPPSQLQTTGPPVHRLAGLLTFVVVIGILYFGRDVLIPVALSVLLSFLLAPAVRMLERARLHRFVATGVVATLAFGLLAGLAWVAATQLLTLAGSIPEYRDNIRAKLVSLQEEGSFSRASRTMREIGSEVAAEQAAEQAPQRTSARATAAPMPVTIAESSPTPMDSLANVGGSWLAPLGTAAAVAIFTLIMLLQREDLRNRVIRLVGHGQLNVTTEAFEEAGERVSNYLRMQLVVNVLYGLPVGIGLYFIGIPNAALWGLLAVALRFIPYLGPVLAAAMPVALAFAISDGWTLMAWTLGLFLTLEIISNNLVEPWLYSIGTGLSPIAIMVGAIFWTWLWGPVGLLLSTPLTVCLVVLGRHVPRFAFLNVMLGDEPVLSPPARVYQRLLAMDWLEAANLAEKHVDEHGLDAFYDDVLVPTLTLAEHDRHAGALEDERERFVFDSVRRFVDDLPARASVVAPVAPVADAAAPVPPRAPALCIIAARDDADELIAGMLQQMLAAHGIVSELIPSAALSSEAVERVAQAQVRMVCISALPPAAVLHASALCKRLRARLPEIRIVVALWHAGSEMEAVRKRFQAVGADDVVTSLRVMVDRGIAVGSTAT